MSCSDPLRQICFEGESHTRASKASHQEEEDGDIGALEFKMAWELKNRSKEIPRYLERREVWELLDS